MATPVPTTVSLKRKPSGKECAVAQCCLRCSDGVSIHSFPRDTSLNRQWVQFVRTCRAHFVPTANSFICSRHFSTSCYPDSYRLRERMGLPVKFRKLLPTAVPSIQKHDLSKLTIGRKRPKGREPTLSTTKTSTSQAATAPETTVTCSVTSSVMSSTLGVTCVRGAYAKREHKRVLAQALEENRILHGLATSQTSTQSSSTESVQMECETAQKHQEQPQQTHFVDGRPSDEHPRSVDTITGQFATFRKRRVQAPSRVSESDPSPQKISKPAAAKVLLKSQQSHAVNSCSSSAAGQNQIWSLGSSSLLPRSSLLESSVARKREDERATFKKPVLVVNLGNCKGCKFLLLKTPKLTKQQLDSMKFVQKERITEHQSDRRSGGDMSCISQEALKRGGGDNCFDHTLTCVKLERNLEDDTNPVQVEETERTRHSEPFPVSLIKCERFQSGELASYRYLPLVTDGHPLSDHSAGQLGQTVSHTPAFQSCVATSVVKLEEGCGSLVATPEIKQEEGCDGKSGTGQCEAWLRESGGESVQKPPLPDEDFRVVLNPDYVKEEALDCQEREEEQESAVPFGLQVKVEPGCSPPATCSVHESQGPQTGLK